MPAHEFKAIIFDLDGLMTDTEPVYWAVARELAGRHGTRVTDATLRRMMGRSRTDSIRIFANECGITDVSPEKLLEQREQMILDRFKQGIEPMPGLREMLSCFRGRLKFAIATSAPFKFTDVMLPALGLTEHFDVIQTGDGIVNGKPDPEIYLKAIASLHLEPAECIVLEDAPAGALAGHRAGAYVVAIPTHLTAGEDFSFADARASSLVEASSKIDQLLSIRNTGC